MTIAKFCLLPKQSHLNATDGTCKVMTRVDIPIDVQTLVMQLFTY